MSYSRQSRVLSIFSSRHSSDLGSNWASVNDGL